MKYSAGPHWPTVTNCANFAEPRGPVSLAPGSRVPGALCLWGLGTTVFVLSALFDLRAELSIRAAPTCFSWRNLLFNCLISLLYETAALPSGDRRWLHWLVAARACLPASCELRARASYFIFTNWVVQGRVSARHFMFTSSTLTHVVRHIVYSIMSL